MNSAEHASRVILSENDGALAAPLIASLRALGSLVTEAKDGTALMEALRASPEGFYRLVVADQRVLHHLGVECLDLIRARAHFVIVTGIENPALHAAARKNGATAVLRRPVHIETLLGLVHDLMGVTPVRTRPPLIAIGGSEPIRAESHVPQRLS
jgi:DNA-binding NtrC family response regulator